MIRDKVPVRTGPYPIRIQPVGLGYPATRIMGIGARSADRAGGKHPSGATRKALTDMPR